MDRAPGLSVRLKLTLSYAGFLVVAGSLLLAAMWLFILRYISDGVTFRTWAFVYSRSDPLNGFAYPAALLMAFLLSFGLVGGWILAGRMLAPLNRIGHATRLAASGTLSHRIRLPGRLDEFRELADAFDAMLARLEAHVAEQQRFAANASHELRTPLAVTQTMLEIARKDPDRDTGELVERLLEVNARAIELTEAMLLLSRADGRSFSVQPVDLSLLVEEVVETLVPLAEARGISIETSGEISPTRGSAPLLRQLATNLLHNAITHNLPDRGSVWVTTSVLADTVALTVENTGEALSPDLVSTLAEPFQRGAQRRRIDHGGVGLGLAIVQSIAQAHGGTLTLAARPTGGLRATVHLARKPKAERAGSATVGP